MSSPVQNLRQPPLLLLLVGQTQQVGRYDVVVQSETDAAVAARDRLLGDDRVVAEVAVTATSIGLRHGHAEEALLAGLQPHSAVDDLVLLPLLVVRRDMSVQERAIRLSKQVVFGLEQRALVMDDTAHGFYLRGWYGLLPPNVPHPTGWLVERSTSRYGEFRALRCLPAAAEPGDHSPRPPQVN